VGAPPYERGPDPRTPEDTPGRQTGFARRPGVSMVLRDPTPSQRSFIHLYPAVSKGGAESRWLFLFSMNTRSYSPAQAKNVAKR
jgi:hypothetical protein